MCYTVKHEAKLLVLVNEMQEQKDIENVLHKKANLKLKLTET